MTAYEVGRVVFTVKDGNYTVAELAAWMGVSPAFVYNATLNGDIVSTKCEDGTLLIPFNFVEFMFTGGNENENLD